MRNAAAKAVWPLCKTPRATSMAPVGVSRTKIPPYPPATASRGVPAPMSWRISNDRLWPATWSRYRLCTFSRPRSQVRRMPPRSRLWAKQRSTISARSLKASRATPDLSRARLLVTARRAASSPCQREKPVCLGAAIRGCVSKVVEIGFGASPSGLSFAAVRPRGQGFRRRLADRGFPIHRLCASGFGRKRGAPRGASALFRDTAARSVF